MTKKTLRRIMIWSSILIIFTVLGYFGIKIYNNYVEPFLMAKKYSLEELKELTDDKKIIEEVIGLEIREFTDEEKEAIEKGESNEGAVMEEIIKEAYETTGTVADKDSIIAKYLSELYSLQSYYTGVIEGMIVEIKTYYYDLRIKHKFDKETSIAKTSNKYMAAVKAKEAECDSRVNSIISRLKNELTKNKFDTSVISTIKERYNAEKQSKRAYYMKLLMSGRNK